jgi:hypothetical protein
MSDLAGAAARRRVRPLRIVLALLGLASLAACMGIDVGSVRRADDGRD